VTPVSAAQALRYVRRILEAYLRLPDTPGRARAQDHELAAQLHRRGVDEEIVQAQARLQQAEWNAAQIERQIADAEVRAPFDGTVGSVHVRAGELVSPGQPLVTLGDLATLRVETTDLDEVDVAQVAVDRVATVTFDALPDRVFTGRVTRVSPMAEPGTGGVHYTVVVELQEMDSTLRWGMTAFVDIEVDKE